ncbi:MAG: energy-coupling factor transporter transmembrane protein EcfT [Anaerolineales bacterium]|nr:energy-coupling factor transporter transmembrane protein EcfT [Anaerolineales bacterium]
MAGLVDFYAPGESWLHRADARVKLLFVFCALVFSILNKNLWLMLATLLGMLLLHVSARTPWSRLRFIWRTILPVALLMLTLRVVFYPEGEPLFAFWLVRITLIAIAQGIVLAARLLTMALAVFAWLYTTSQTDLVQSMVRLGLPHEYGLVLALALRYIPTFQGIFNQISEAQQARGLDFSQHKGWRRVRAMMPIFVSMIITSLRTSQQLALALEARGYGRKGARRTALVGLRYRPVDYLLTFGLIMMLAAFVFVYFRYGVGAAPIAIW